MPPASAQRSAESTGCKAGHSAEIRRQMRLAGKPYVAGDLRDWALPDGQQFACALDPPLDEIVVRRTAGRGLECLSEMMSTESREARQIGKRYLVTQMRRDEIDHTP